MIFTLLVALGIKGQKEGEDSEGENTSVKITCSFRNIRKKSIFDVSVSTKLGVYVGMEKFSRVLCWGDLLCS